MKKTDLLTVKYHNRAVGTLSLTPDNKLCAFEYAPSWLAEGFSISPLELPLQPGLFLAKPTPYYGNFGIFEDCLPDGTGRPTLSDFCAVGNKVKMSERRCRELVEEVTASCGNLIRYVIAK